MRIISVADIAEQLRGVTVMVRSSLNVPVANGVVTNAFRLDAALQTISFLSAHGAKVVVISHIGDTPTATLAPIFDALRKKIDVQFVSDVVGEAARAAVSSLKPGGVLLLENLRRDAGEKANDERFTRALASLADVFVNDDFAAAHRAHASVVGVPKFLPSYAGLQFMHEFDGLSAALSPQSPSLAIVGGAKFVTKEPLVRALMQTYDNVFIGGALANDFFKAKGYAVGRSLVSHAPDLGDLLKNSKLMCPIDVTVDGAHGRVVKEPQDVLDTDTIYDAGPATVIMLTPLIQKARMVLWNGPTGNFENGFVYTTEELARIIAAAPGKSVVGGGDTIAAIQKLGLNDKFELLSTAGGAMLDFLAHGTLPGIEALESSRKI